MSSFPATEEPTVTATTPNQPTATAKNLELPPLDTPSTHLSNAKRTSVQIGQKSKKDLMLRQLIVCCGPSGAGKSTLIKRLMKNHPGRFGFSVSHTTRGPREGEVNKEDYHFVNHEEMEVLLDATKRRKAGDESAAKENYMLEHAHVHTNVYGTSANAVRDVIQKPLTGDALAAALKDLEAAGAGAAGGEGSGSAETNELSQKCILDIDVQGVESMKKLAEWDTKAAYIFIVPPTLEDLEKRLRGRGTETEEKIVTRLKNAKIEMRYLTEVSAGFWDAIVVNDEIDRAYQEFEKAVVLGETSQN